MKVRENNRPERDSNLRPLTLYVGALPTELLGHASKSLLKGRSFACTAPLLTNLHRGAIAAPSQCALDLLLREDCSHQEAWPDSSVGRAPTYKVRGHKFESRSGWLFSRTFTFHFFQTLLLLLNFPQLYPVDGAAMAPLV